MPKPMFIVVNAGHVIERFKADNHFEAIEHCKRKYGDNWAQHYELCAVILT